VCKCFTTPLLGLPPLPPHSTGYTLRTLHPAPASYTALQMHGRTANACPPGPLCMPCRPSLPVLPLPWCSLTTPRSPLSLPLGAYARMGTDGLAETSGFPRHASWSRLWDWAVRFRRVGRRRGTETTVAESAVPACVLKEEEEEEEEACVLNKHPHPEHSTRASRACMFWRKSLGHQKGITSLPFILNLSYLRRRQAFAVVPIGRETKGALSRPCSVGLQILGLGA